MSYKYVARVGVLAALAIILSYFEMLIPAPVPFPGIKLGLANIVVVIALYTLGPKIAFNISIVRVFSVAFLFGNLSTLMYSLTSALVSFTFMYLFKKTKLFSIVGVSIIGSFAHVTTQIFVAALIVEDLSVITWLPVLTVSAVVSGFLIGYIAHTVVNNFVANNISQVKTQTKKTKQ